MISNNDNDDADIFINIFTTITGATTPLTMAVDVSCLSTPPAPTIPLPYDLPRHRLTSSGVLTTVLMLLCVCLTIAGNVLVVLSVSTYRPLRCIQNIYIVSLAVADLAVAVVVMPLHVISYALAGRWIFGAIVCNVWLTADILACTASILNLCAIAIDRYKAIHDPISYSQRRSAGRVLINLGVVWFVSVVISVPPLIGWNNSAGRSLYDVTHQTCQLTDDRGFVVYSAAGSFYIPLVVMTFVYCNIYRATRARLRARALRGTMASTTGAKATSCQPKLNNIAVTTARLANVMVGSETVGIDSDPTPVWTRTSINNTASSLSNDLVLTSAGVRPINIRVLDRQPAVATRCVGAVSSHRRCRSVSNHFWYDGVSHASDAQTKNAITDQEVVRNEDSLHPEGNMAKATVITYMPARTDKGLVSVENAGENVDSDTRSQTKTSLSLSIQDCLREGNEASNSQSGIHNCPDKSTNETKLKDMKAVSDRPILSSCSLPITSTNNMNVSELQIILKATPSSASNWTQSFDSNPSSDLPIMLTMMSDFHATETPACCPTNSLPLAIVTRHSERREQQPDPLNDRSSSMSIPGNEYRSVFNGELLLMSQNLPSNDKRHKLSLPIFSANCRLSKSASLANLDAAGAEDDIRRRRSAASLYVDGNHAAHINNNTNINEIISDDDDEDESRHTSAVTSSVFSDERKKSCEVGCETQQTPTSAINVIASQLQIQRLAERKQRVCVLRERRIVHTMAIIMVAFVVCWLPFFVLYVILPFCAPCSSRVDRGSVVVVSAVWLGYLNSALNPVIYTVFNVDFRRAFAALLHLGRHHHGRLHSRRVNMTQQQALRI